MTDQELNDIETRASRVNADLGTTQGDVRTLVSELRRMRKDDAARNTADGERKHIATRARQMGWKAPEGWKDDQDQAAAGATSSKDTQQTSVTRMTGGGPETKQAGAGEGDTHRDSNNRTK